jgi:hypothetical protein
MATVGRANGRRNADNELILAECGDPHFATLMPHSDGQETLKLLDCSSAEIVVFFEPGAEGSFGNGIIKTGHSSRNSCDVVGHL